MNKPSGIKLYCFSPPVMIATFVVEVTLMAYALWRYKLDMITKLIALTVLSLAIFQVAEYNVCTGSGLSGETWSRIGYVAITILPALGLHILHLIAGKPKRRLVYTAYTTMAGFIGFFLAYHAAFIGYQCTGNYVIFQIGMYPSIAYGIYYYGWLLTAIVLGIIWINQLNTGKAASRPTLQAIRALILGYMVFLVPTAITYSVDPSTRRGIPSIMCGFAVLFALILVLYILPLVVSRKSSSGISTQPTTHTG